MAANPGTTPAYPVAIPQTQTGRLQYVLSLVDWQLLSLSFSLDATNASASRTAFVKAFTQANATIVAAYIAVSVPAGSTAIYSLAPYLNPCDSFTSTFGLQITDTFPALTLTEGCTLRVSAVDATTGAVVTDTPLSNGLAWVSDVGATSLPALEPVYLPVPIVAGGLTAAAAGG